MKEIEEKRMNTNWRTNIESSTYVDSFNVLGNQNMLKPKTRVHERVKLLRKLTH